MHENARTCSNVKRVALVFSLIPNCLQRIFVRQAHNPAERDLGFKSQPRYQFAKARGECFGLFAITTKKCKRTSHIGFMFFGLAVASVFILESLRILSFVSRTTSREFPNGQKAKGRGRWFGRKRLNPSERRANSRQYSSVKKAGRGFTDSRDFLARIFARQAHNPAQRDLGFKSQPRYQFAKRLGDFSPSFFVAGTDAPRSPSSREEKCRQNRKQQNAASNRKGDEN